jgi:polyhydroxybutyrate depolymerase
MFGLLALVAIVATCAALLAYFVYSPTPKVPNLSGLLTKGSIEVGGLKRSYRVYVPRGLPKHSPLVVVMHGSGEDGATIRKETGYRFEQLSDEHGFVVVYPDSYSFDWDDCSVVGDFVANGRDVDDVGFLIALTDKLIAENALDRNRVFATGVSAGGFMSIRLALEAPSRFRAVAPVSANVPAPDNFKCHPIGQGTSVLFMNGTKDPLVPFGGGEVNLLGFFYKGGNVLSSRDSARYFADLDKIADPPKVSQAHASDGADTERLLWKGDAGLEVELVAIQGGGHGIPQAVWRRPRLLGPSPMAPDGPGIIWSFFERQRK